MPHEPKEEASHHSRSPKGACKSSHLEQLLLAAGHRPPDRQGLTGVDSSRFRLARYATCLHQKYRVAAFRWVLLLRGEEERREDAKTPTHSLAITLAGLTARHRSTCLPTSHTSVGKRAAGRGWPVPQPHHLLPPQVLAFKEASIAHPFFPFRTPRDQLPCPLSR